MKETYEALQMDVILFETEDIILTSDPDEDEGPMVGGNDNW